MMNYSELSDEKLIELYERESGQLSFYNAASGESYSMERTLGESCAKRRKEIVAECKARGLDLPVGNYLC